MGPDPIKSLENLINTPMMEYEDLRTNIDFKIVNANNKYRVPQSKIFGDYKVHLYGNLEKIIIEHNNSMRLIVRYRTSPEYDCRVDVGVYDEEIRQTIRRYVKTTTGVKMTCKFGHNSILCLDCVELEEYNLPLKIPFYICSECGRTYIDGEETNVCEICGPDGKMHKVDDFYKFVSEHNLFGMM